MGLCWFCYWGWPKPIADIYQRAVRDINAINGNGENVMQFGPAHITWSDENFDHSSVDYCISECSDQRLIDEHGPEAIAIVKRSLEELQEVDDVLKEAPEGYDDEHPENFPPTTGVEYVNPNA